MTIGGCDFAADSDLDWRAASVFWNPAVAADVVCCASSPISLAAGPKIFALLERAVVQREADDGVHLLWPEGEQLWLVAPVDPERHAAALLALDRTHARRSHATANIWRRLQGLPSMRRRTPSDLRLRQLTFALRAISGLREGLSYREVAAALFGADRVPSGIAWKSSDLRSRVVRLAKEGRHLVQGGYLYLLR